MVVSFVFLHFHLYIFGEMESNLISGIRFGVGEWVGELLWRENPDR